MGELLPKYMKVYDDVMLPPIKDANAIEENCIIYTGSTVVISNIPADTGSIGGVLETIFNGGTKGDISRGYQRFSDRQNAIIWVRSKTKVGTTSEAWTQWKKIGS